MIKQFLKEDRKKLNSLTKYPSILTFHKMVNGNLIDSPYEDNIDDFYATEKIDGTNVRIIIDYSGNVVIGSRENLLYLNGEYFYDTSQGIVEYFLKNDEKIKELVDTSLYLDLLNERNDLVIIYGELYGGKIGKGAKNYGIENDFRIFDIAKINDSNSFLEWPIEKISSWRETETDNGMIYGQNFLSRNEIVQLDFQTIQLVPLLHEIKFKDVSIKNIFETLSQFKQTQAAIDETSLLQPEGVVIRKDQKRYKIRFEDYKKYFKQSGNLTIDEIFNKCLPPTLIKH